MNRIFLLTLAMLAVSVTAGNVGACRSECVELNKFKIVRVHLKSEWVMAGVCRNTTQTTGANKATVFPFICNRNVGAWLPDENDDEGIVNFPVKCPANQPVDSLLLATCPRGENSF
ncbi:unnamed protein product, partial [Mesorhabditis belari]|uniref:Uncharacterized protein n=1 Tax=Mesorhabditis belari TaxID=2138241 RepID=A0AAF3FH22_9BILA